MVRFGMHNRRSVLRRSLAAVTATLVLTTSAVALSASPSFGANVVTVSDPANAIPDEYIVTLKHSTAADAAGAAATAARLATTYGGTVDDVYSTVLFGFSLHITAAKADQLVNDVDVAAVTQDTYVYAADTQTNAPWGLDRLDQRYLTDSTDRTYAPLNDAETVTVYVLDTGVNTSNVEFGGRASFAYDAVDQSATVDPGDCDTASGHGTHVAGIVGGKIYGVAKKVQIRSVNALRCSGKPDGGEVIRAVDWVAQNAVKPAVVNMSIQTNLPFPPLDTAVTSALGDGLTIVAAAGNYEMDACDSSPGRVPGVITVGATDAADARWSDSASQGSNYGSCVDLFAPGVGITAAGRSSSTALNTLTGTSMAAPHVSGVAAMLFAMHPKWTSAQMAAALVGRATPDVVTDVKGTPNRLLNIGPLSGMDGGALPAGDLNTMWNTYGDQGNHWTGGDTTESVPLPDGRIAWLFSDTFLGTVNADHSRPANTPMIHNSIVVQKDNTLTTLTGGAAGHPEALVGPAAADAPDGDIGYWAYDGTVEGNKLRVLYNHFTTDGDSLSYQQTGTFLATFSLPALTLDSLVDLHIGATVAWGAGILEDGGYTYMYGTEGAAGVKYLHLARVASGGITGAWSYWDGSGWSSSESASARMMSGVDAPSVDKINGSYVMISQDADGFFSSDIVAYFAEKPTGPFADKTTVYTAPETQVSGNIVYGAHSHPELGAPGSLVVSYNVNTLLPNGNTNDARIYRPRFISVTLPEPPDPVNLPKPPTNLAAVSNGQGVKLSWTASATAGVSYRVYQRDLTIGQTQATRTGSPSAATTATPGLLTNGDQYEFFVTAVKGGLESPRSNLVRATPSVTAPTSAPTGLTATANPDGSAGLAWTASAGATWYRVYRKDTTDNETTFTLLPDQIFATTATIRGLENGHVYQFEVAGTTTGGVGPPSAPATMTAQIAPPPAPTNLTATPNPDGTISLKWTSQGPYIWFWVYRRDVTLGEEFDHGAYPATTNTLEASYLTPGHTYEFKVSAINAGGEGPASATVSAKSTIALPAAPKSLTAVKGNGEVALSWTAPAAGLWYWVYYKDTTAGDATFTRAMYPISTGTTFTAGYLVNGHVYAFYVTAINAGGEGPASNQVTATPAAPLPAAPTGLAATALGDGSIKISWTATDPDLWYWIYQKDVTAGGGFVQLPYPLTTGTTFTAGGLTYGHQYQYQVSAITSGGEGPRSAIASATSKLDPPTDLTAVATGDGQAQLSWRGAVDGSWYWLYYRDVTAGQTFQKAVYPITETSFTWGATTSGHQYEFKVTAIGAGGESAPSATVKVTVQGGTPAAPTLTGAAGNAKFTLSWTAPEAGASYWIYRRCVGCGETKLVPLPYPVSGATSFVDTAVVNGYAYQYRVSAVNSHGEGGWSNAVSGTPLPPLPGAPTGLTATTSDMTIKLKWTAPGSGLLYWIYSRDVTAGQTGFTRSKYPSDQTSLTVTPLTDGHRFEYYVTAVNVAGEGPKSGTVNGTPMPGKPSGLSASNVQNVSLDLDWSAPTPAGVWYVIYMRDVTLGQGFTKMNYPTPDTHFTVAYLHHGHTFEFYVASVRGDGESDGSNVVRVVLQPPNGAMTCDQSKSNYLTVPKVKDPLGVLLGKVKYVQRRDMLLQACMYYGPTGSSTRQVTVKINWNSSGYPLNYALFRFYLVDCTTGQQIKIDSYAPNANLTSGTADFSYYVDPSHYYRAYAAGNGSIQYGPPGKIGVESRFDGWYPPSGIDQLLPNTACL